MSVAQDRYAPDDFLPVTPSPIPGEGFRGFILRVSEENGYHSPFVLLHHLAIPSGRMMRLNMPVEPLAAVLGISATQLAALRWHQQLNALHRDPGEDANGRPSWLRRNQPGSAKLCPRCVAEHGRLDAAWEHRLVLGCPKHGTWLVRRCGTCQQELSWFRPGLLTCKCGSVILAEDRPMPEGLIALFTIIHDQFHALPPSSIPNCGVPETALRALGIEGLLALLTRFGGIVESRQGDPMSLDELVLNLGTIFEDWPTGFHRFMQRIRKALPEDTPGTFSTGKQFPELHWTIFKGGGHSLPRERLGFLRTAYVQFASSQWNAVVPDARLIAKVGLDISEVKVTGITEFARRIGIRLVTARSWAQKSVFPSRQIKVGNAVRTIIEVPTDLPEKVDVPGMGLRDAGKFLDLPVSVVAELKRLGTYRVRHFGGTPAPYHPIDLELFRSELLAKAAPRIDSPASNHTTLSEVLRRKFRTEKTKALIVKAFIDGEIRAAGRIGDRLPDIIFDRNEMERVVDEKTHATQFEVSAHVAAKYLDCDGMVIREMLDKGLIEGREHGRELRITVSSIAAFSSRYVACRSIAALKGTSVRRVMNICKRLGISLLLVSRSNEKSAQPFAPRDGLASLGVVEQLKPFVAPNPGDAEPMPDVEKSAAIYRLVDPGSPTWLAPTTTLAQRLAIFGIQACRQYRLFAPVSDVPLPSSTSTGATLTQGTLRHPSEASEVDLPSDPFDRRKWVPPRERLLAYLNALETEGACLPRRAGKLNIRAIAASCGFDRKVLYNNPVIRAMLDDYANAEAIRRSISASRAS